MAKTAIVRARSSMPVEQVARKIYLIRGQRVMIDSDLAEIYTVATKALNQAVKRNSARFPTDFMFQLSTEEADNLRSQFATSNLRSQIVTSSLHGGRRTLPYAFTEHGVAMLSSVLNSERAVQMNILVVRAFIKVREVLATNRELAHRVERLTTTVKDHAALFEVVIEDINKMDQKLARELRRLQRPRTRKPRIGFLV